MERFLWSCCAFEPKSTTSFRMGSTHDSRSREMRVSETRRIVFRICTDPSRPIQFSFVKASVEFHVILLSHKQQPWPQHTVAIPYFYVHPRNSKPHKQPQPECDSWCRLLPSLSRLSCICLLAGSVSERSSSVSLQIQ